MLGKKQDRLTKSRFCLSIISWLLVVIPFTRPTVAQSRTILSETNPSILNASAPTSTSVSSQQSRQEFQPDPNGFQEDDLPIPQTPATQQTALRILHRSLLESVWGQPIVCDLRQEVRVFDKKRTGFGKYVRGGRGSGRMRLNLQIPGGDQMNSLVQVGDGELLHTLSTVGDRSIRSQIDLGKIRDRLTLTPQSLQDPTIAMYLAIGGQAEVLRKLSQQYRWNEVHEGMLGRRPVWWISGTVAAQPLSNHAKAPIDIRLFEERSGLTPTRATIAVGHLNSDSPFWLFQVEETHRSADQPTSQLTVTTEWDSPIRLEDHQLVPDLFRLSSQDNQTWQETRDETKLYLPPIQSNR